MSSGARVSLARAESLGVELCLMLQAHCEQLHLAGSARRRRPSIGDLELVYQPKLVEVGRLPPDLFLPARPRMGSAVRLALEKLLAIGTFQRAKGDPFGSRHQRVTYDGMAVDLFAAPADTLGWILVLRTGPKEFNLAVLGALKARGIHSDGGRLFRGDAPLPTPTEASVFQLAGMPFVPPEDRDAR